MEEREAMSNASLEKDRIDALYRNVKQFNPHLYSDICAFSSTIIDGDDIESLKTKARIERFCMGIIDRVIHE